MVYHVLNGDSLAYSFPSSAIRGEIIVAREALVEGSLPAGDLAAFWKARAAYHQTPYATYHQNVVTEFDKILTAPPHSEFNGWFEYDLFCQVNMWFTLSLIASLSIPVKVYAVYSSFLTPDDKNFWNGFGPATQDQLIRSFHDRILLNNQDIQLGQQLWNAYQNADLAQLQLLSRQPSAGFPYLQEVVEAHIARFPTADQKGRPERVLEEIMETHPADFPAVCRAFWQRESIYGFGDTQIKHLCDNIIS